MASTTKGIIYPTSGDNIAPLETHFASLAQSVDDAIVDTETALGKSPIMGYKSFTGPESTGSTVDVTVTFAAAFDAAPFVVATVQGGGSVSAYSVTLTGTPNVNGFTAKVYRLSGSTAETDLYLHWIAK